MENKINLMYYEIVVNGKTDDRIPLNLIVQSEEEVEKKRKELEKKHQCWTTNMITKQKKKIKDIMFIKGMPIANM